MLSLENFSIIDIDKYSKQAVTARLDMLWPVNLIKSLRAGFPFYFFCNGIPYAVYQNVSIKLGEPAIIMKEIFGKIIETPDMLIGVTHSVLHSNKENINSGIFEDVITAEIIELVIKNSLEETVYYR